MSGKTQSRARIAYESLRATVWEASGVLEAVRRARVVQGQGCLALQADGLREGVSGQKILGGSARAT